EGQVVGMDGSVMSVSIAEGLERAIQEIGGSCELRYDLLAEIWPDRPSIPSTTPYQHPLEFVGAEKTKKLGQLQHVLREEGLAHYLVIGLDEIAWLLNIRAADVAYNPLCLSYLLVQPTGAVWFVGVHRVPDDLKALLKEAGVQLADYQDLPAELMRINATDEPIGMDTQMASVAVYQAAGGPRVQKIQSPISIWKAIKGAKEVDHYYRAMARDGVALLRLRRWLTAEAAPKGKSEAEIGDKLASFRAEQDFYHGESFPAIVGYRSNGAIVHYRAQPETCANIAPSGLLLLDSGGQYFDGTTDITRTFSLGNPSVAAKLHFTLVLKGHIDLAMAKFPKGTTGVQLDTLARRPLWEHQLNYGHGTGHGVGYFLNVHEGPMGISPNPKAGTAQVPLQAGMVLSNEPGFYQDEVFNTNTIFSCLVITG
ncbi:MAG: M24 family metallopeptidase, partial [Bacteroidota bacterium]